MGQCHVMHAHHGREMPSIRAVPTLPLMNSLAMRITWVDVLPRPAAHSRDGARLHEDKRHKLNSLLRGGVRLTARPPFRRGEGGRVGDKLLSLRIVGGRGLKAAHKGAVPQLRLCVGSDQLEAHRLRQPLCLLLGAGLRQERGDEHLHRTGADKLVRVQIGTTNQGALPS